MGTEKKTTNYRGVVGSIIPTGENTANTKPPSQLSQIFTGWGNYVKSHFVDLAPELKALSTNRLLTCNACDMRNGGTCDTNKTGTNIKTGAQVRGCGCRLAAKALSPGSGCPLGKW